MPRLSSVLNFRIGTKLMLVSGLSALLMLGMIATQMPGNSAVSDSNGNALRLAEMERNTVEAKASQRGTQTGMRDLRLARTSEQFEKPSNISKRGIKARQSLPTMPCARRPPRPKAIV